MLLLMLLLPAPLAAVTPLQPAAAAAAATVALRWGSAHRLQRYTLRRASKAASALLLWLLPLPLPGSRVTLQDTGHHGQHILAS
jgi:hypothetical protein